MAPRTRAQDLKAANSEAARVKKKAASATTTATMVGDQTVEMMKKVIRSRDYDKPARRAAPIRTPSECEESTIDCTVLDSSQAKSRHDTEKLDSPSARNIPSTEVRTFYPEMFQRELNHIVNCSTELYNHIKKLKDEPSEEWKAIFDFLQEEFEFMIRKHIAPQSPFIDWTECLKRLPDRTDEALNNRARDVITTANNVSLLRYLAKVTIGTEQPGVLLTYLNTSFSWMFDTRPHLLRDADFAEQFDLAFRIRVCCLAEDIEESNSTSQQSSHHLILAAQRFCGFYPGSDLEQATQRLRDGPYLSFFVHQGGTHTTVDDEDLSHRMNDLQELLAKDSTSALQDLSENYPRHEVFQDVRAWAMKALKDLNKSAAETGTGYQEPNTMEPLEANDANMKGKAPERNGMDSHKVAEEQEESLFVDDHNDGNDSHNGINGDKGETHSYVLNRFPDSISDLQSRYSNKAAKTDRDDGNSSEEEEDDGPIIRHSTKVDKFERDDGNSSEEEEDDGPIVRHRDMRVYVANKLLQDDLSLQFDSYSETFLDNHVTVPEGDRQLCAAPLSDLHSLDPETVMSITRSSNAQLPPRNSNGGPSLANGRSQKGKRPIESHLGSDDNDDNDDVEDDFETNERPVNMTRRIDKKPMDMRGRVFKRARPSVSAEPVAPRSPSMANSSILGSGGSNGRPGSSLGAAEVAQLSTQAKEVARQARASKPNSMVKPKQVRAFWTAVDSSILIDAISKYNCAWSAMEHANLFSTPRTQQAIRDKARNLKVDFLKAGQPFPAGFDGIALGKKEKNIVMACGCNPDRTEQDVDEDGNATNVNLKADQNAGQEARQEAEQEAEQDDCLKGAG